MTGNVQALAADAAANPLMLAVMGGYMTEDTASEMAAGVTPGLLNGAPVALRPADGVDGPEVVVASEWLALPDEPEKPVVKVVEKPGKLDKLDGRVVGFEKFGGFGVVVRGSVCATENE